MGVRFFLLFSFDYLTSINPNCIQRSLNLLEVAFMSANLMRKKEHCSLVFQAIKTSGLVLSTGILYLSMGNIMCSCDTCSYYRFGSYSCLSSKSKWYDKSNTTATTRYRYIESFFGDFFCTSRVFVLFIVSFLLIYAVHTINVTDLMIGNNMELANRVR